MGLVAAIGFGVFGQAQEAQPHEENFYKNLARRDAKFEHAFKAIDPKGEADYWSDQKNFELGLGKANFDNYLSYLFEKANAYRAHIAVCSEECKHTDLFNHHAEAYLGSQANMQQIGIAANANASAKKN